MRRVLVTGAAGFLGSHLVERLLARGIEVVGADAFRPFYDPELKRAHLAKSLGVPGFHLWTMELERLREPDAPDVDGVFHLAAQAGVRDSWGDEFGVYLRDNVLATERLLEAYRRHPPRFFVYASSSSVYGAAERFPTGEEEPPRPYSPYGVTKLAAEHLCQLYHRNFGLPVVALRLFTLYGPRQRPDMAFHRFLEAHREGRPLPLYGDGSQRRDFTYVDDAVDGFLLAAERGRAGSVYNLGSGAPHSLTEVLAMIERVSGRAPRVEPMPRPAGDVAETGADTTRARQELGFSPRVSLEEGLARQWAWQERSGVTEGVR